MARHVLIVDDDKFLRCVFRNMLVKRGFHVSEAENGAEALAKVCASPPDLILMDVMMPEMDGFALCEAIRSNDSTNHIPIIILSAMHSSDIRERSKHSSANVILSKPVKATQLINSIEGLLGKFLVCEKRDRSLP